MPGNDFQPSRIPPEEARAGDILVFKGEDMAYRLISPLLRLFEPKWDGWGWHMGFVVRIINKATFRAETCESLAEGVQLCERYLDSPGVRVYRWFPREPKEPIIKRFLDEHLGLRYDVAIYFWTALQYLVRHYWNRRIPRMLDDRYTCWENVWEFCAETGHPIGSKYDCPMITDFFEGSAGSLAL